MSITTTSQVNVESMPIAIKIGVNGVVKVKAQGEAGDSFRDVLLAAVQKLELDAAAFVGDANELRETVTLLRDGLSSRLATADETVKPGDMLIVNQPNKNG